MFGIVDRDGGSARPFLAWIGLLLMVASFVWLQLLSPKSGPQVDIPAPATDSPFALVVLDPGHGGQDSGTMKFGILEKELALDVAHRVERLLQLQGIATLLTRADDTYVSLADRAAIANAQRNCVFVSIHFDDAARSAATGVETYYAAHQISNSTGVASWLPFLQQASLESANVESQSLAAFIQEALVTRTQALNRGTTPHQFYVITHVRHPAVLIEGGFLTNADEKNKLATGDYREQIAAAISDGVMHYREVLQQQRTPLAVKLPSGK
ncbi:MAG: N-acetylmuramoyl-L-alanine amidase [Verrucomicrobiota bacterium]|jgi:N-acetylmuramoyl-L-alanine amidase